MSIKMDIQGLLIYLSLAVYAVVVFNAIKYPKTSSKLFVLSFILSFSAFFFRWQAVQHIPMQNMFEVFLSLGVCVWPIHLLSKRLLRQDHPAFMVIDAAIGFIVLFPAGFIFSHKPQLLPPALQSWLFGPHVAAYMLSYIFMFKAAVFAFAGLITQKENIKTQQIMALFNYRLITAGFPLLTLGLFLGSVWGKYAWGDWWGWDPKELWSLVCWLLYVIYLHVRFGWPKSFRIQHLLSILGFTAIIITLLWVNLSKIFTGLHNYAA